MKPLYKILLGWWFFTVCLGNSQAQPNTTMYVNGRHLYSAIGEKVVFRGVNEMFIYSSDRQGVTTLPQIAQTGANVVRICWNTSGSASDLDALLGNAIANKIIPIVQLDDITGNLNNLQTCLNYWKRADVLTAMNKYKKWVLLNIANEAGDNYTTDAQFQTAYTDAVSQLRTAGYTIPLVIDADGYGQNETAIVNTWNALLQSDPQHNLLFSVHPYWKDVSTQNLQTRFTNLFNAVVSTNIPFIIGEGPQQTGWDCSTQIPYSWVMQQCQTNQIGWLVWTWGKVQDGTNGCGINFDVTTNGNYGSWSNAWGQAIAVSDPNSIQNTSVRPPSILGNSTPDTMAPSAPANLAVSTINATAATLVWTASSDNVGVTAYAIYQGTTQIGTTLTNYSTLTGLSCNTTYVFSVKAKDAAGNESVASNTVSATTSLCDAQAPTAPGNLVAFAGSPTSILLSWASATDNVGVTGYQIFKGATLLTTQAGTSLNVTGLTCNTTYAFTVKAVDAAGNSSAVSNTASATTSACPTGEIVYDDNLNANWQDWSWSSYRYFTTATQKTEGSYSVQVDYGGYGGFALRRNTAITPAANTVIKFWAYSTGATSLDFSTQADDSGPQSNSVFLTTVPNQWKEFTVDMGALGNPSAIKRFNIKNNSGNSPTVYFDYIRFDTNTNTADTQAPTAPTNLAASNVATNALTFTWTAATDNVGVLNYAVYQGTTLLNGAVTGTSFSINNLTCGTSYTFTVKANDAAGNQSPSSNQLIVSTLPCDAQAPSVPGNLAASNATASSLTLSWAAATDNVGVTGYQVYQGTTLLASNVTATTYVVTGLLCATAYTFTVKAFDASGNVSSASNAASGSTAACSPGEVVYDDALNINWQDWSWSATTNLNTTTPVQQGTKSIRADYSGYGGFSLRKNTPITPPTNMLLKFWVYSSAANSLLLYTQNEDSGTMSSTVYFSTVANQWKEITIDMNALGNPLAIKRITIQNNSSNAITAYFDDIRITTGVIDTQPPNSPSLTVSAITQVGLTLSWTASTDNVGVIGYQLYQGSTLLNGNVTGTTYAVTGLTCGTSYNFSVKAKDAAGNSSSSSNVVTPSTLTCPDTQSPTTPTNLTATSLSQTGLTLTWTASTDNVAVSGYQVYQGSTLLNGNVAGTTYAVTGLTCGTSYSYSVKAKDAAGNSSASSNVVTPTTTGCAGATTVVIYDETLNADWNDWSWATTRNFANTSPVKVGTKSARLDYSAWAALSLRKVSTTVTASASTAVRFWIWTPTATTIKVYTSSTDTGGDGAGFTFATTANTWTEKIITNSQLGNPAQIKRIHVQNYTGNAVTAYVDNIRLVSVTGARISADEETPRNELSIFPNPTRGKTQVQYIAEKAGSVQIQVINLQGTILQQKTEQAGLGSNMYDLDLSNQRAGLYLIRLFSSTGRLSKKIELIR